MTWGGRKKGQTNLRTRMRHREAHVRKGRAALVAGRRPIDPTISLDSLAILEEGMRHFYFKAKVLEGLGEAADFAAVDRAWMEAIRIAKDVAQFRHAKISAIKLAGDPNAPLLPENLTIDQLRELIVSDVARLADVLELDAESIRQGVENRLPVAPSNGGED